MELEAIISKRKSRLFKEVRNSFFIILVLLVFRSTMYEPYRIPTGSMIPTLHIGDFILVNKFSYGLKVPFTDIAIFDLNLNPIYIAGKSDPKRGDVIVFKYPVDTSVNYIKRVIGVPGDVLEIRNKIIYINEKPVLVKEINGDKIKNDLDERSKNSNLKFYNSTLDDHIFIIQQDVDNLYSSQFDKITIPEGKFFVMGDNRDSSYDSRFWGFVPRDYIRGKAIYIWFSMTFPGEKEEIKIKWKRIFESIN